MASKSLGGAIFLCLTMLTLSLLLLASAVESNYWESKAALHEARAYLGVAVVDGKIFAIDGDSSNVAVNGPRHFSLKSTCEYH